MRPKYPLLAVLFGVILAVQAVSAAGITLSTDRSEYTFPIGEQAVIPILAENTYDHDVAGFLRTTAVTDMVTQGMSFRSTSSSGRTVSIRKGSSEIRMEAGTADTDQTLTLSFTFDYTEGNPVTVTLGPVTVRFVREGSAKQEGSPVTSSSRQGAPPSSQQQGQGQQQGQQGGSSQQSPQGGGSQQQGGTGNALQNAQLPQDAQALRQQLGGEMAERNRMREMFLEKLRKDPLYTAVNERLLPAGYTPGEPAVETATGENGTFSAAYTGPGKENVAVSGLLEKEGVAYVQEESGPSLPVPETFANDPAFANATSELKSGGLSQTGTIINTTPDQQAVNLTFRDGDGKETYLNATLRNGVVNVSVTRPEQQADEGIPILPIAVIVILLLAMYWLVRRRRAGPEAGGIPEPPAPVDYRVAAERLVAEGDRLFAEGRPGDAYGRIGQALRLVLSYRHGDRSEMTNEEIISALQRSGISVLVDKPVLDRCSEVEFGKGIPDRAEFERFVEFARKRIGEE